jgi:hypothetical protein
MTQKEVLENIRRVFSPSISDLAFVFGVQNYVVYLWLDEIPMEDKYKETLKSLYEAAVIIQESGAVITGWTFRRRIFDGKTMLEAIRSGKSAQELAKQMVEIIKLEAEQRAILDAQLAGRIPRNPPRQPCPESDFPSYADIAD